MWVIPPLFSYPLDLKRRYIATMGYALFLDSKSNISMEEELIYAYELLHSRFASTTFQFSEDSGSLAENGMQSETYTTFPFTIIAFHSTNCQPLSAAFSCSFTENGYTFDSVYQYFSYYKARTLCPFFDQMLHIFSLSVAFNDINQAHLILRAHNIATIEAHAKDIKGYVASEWLKMSFNVMVLGIGLQVCPTPQNNNHFN